MEWVCNALVDAEKGLIVNVWTFITIAVLLSGTTISVLLFGASGYVLAIPLSLGVMLTFLHATSWIMRTEWDANYVKFEISSEEEEV